MSARYQALIKQKSGLIDCPLLLLWNDMRGNWGVKGVYLGVSVRMSLNVRRYMCSLICAGGGDQEKKRLYALETLNNYALSVKYAC